MRNCWIKIFYNKDLEILERCWPNYRMLLTSNRPKNPQQIHQSITNPRTWEHAIFVKSSEVCAIQITSSVACACFPHEWTVLFQTDEHLRWFLETTALLKHNSCLNHSTCSHTETIHQSQDIHNSYIRALFIDAQCLSVLERISKQASLI